MGTLGPAELKKLPVIRWIESTRRETSQDADETVAAGEGGERWERRADK